MKPSLSSCLALLLTLLLSALPATTWAVDPPVRKVTVVGTATIKVVPDEMHWTVQVSMDDSTLTKAKARHDQSLGDALKFIKSFGGAITDLQTGGIRFEKRTWFPDNADRSRPFSCSTQFTFTLADFDKYGPICDGLAKLDGVGIQSVDYASSREDATKRQALINALANAHDKANDLAIAAVCYIDRPLDIQEGTSDAPVPMMMRANLDSGSAGTPAAVPGQLEITRTVTVTYDLFYK